MKTLGSLGIAVAVFAVACADPATSPSRTLAVEPSALHQAPETYAFPPGFPEGLLPGNVRACKTANEGGTFPFTATTDGTGTLIADIDGGTAGNQFQITVPAGGGTVCALVYDSPSGIPLSTIETVTIVEGADLTADWDLTAIHIRQLLAASPTYTAAHLADVEGLASRTATLKVNDDMGRIVDFTNTFTAPPPPTGCTYTKGWYRNNGSSTVISVDGRSVAEAQAIFAATPGKPGGVTFGGDNTLLNLYQQFLAALNNLGGDANEDDGPDAVDAAIDAVRAGTNGTGLNITTTLNQTQMSALIATLAAFNEGALTGWPHCDDN